MTILYCVILLVSILTVVMAQSAQHTELKNGVRKVVSSCALDYDITKQTILNTINKSAAQELDDCFLAYVYQKTGLEEGYILSEQASANIQPYPSDSEYEAVSKLFDKCATTVNVLAPADACESAGLLNKCLGDFYSLLL